MFWIRLRSSAVLVLLALVTILTGGNVLLAALYAVSILAFRELAGACGFFAASEEKKRAGALTWTGYLGITAYYLLLFSFGSRGQGPSTDFEIAMLVIWACAVLLLTFLGTMFVYVFTFPRYQASQVMSSFFCVLYAPVLLSFLYLTRCLENGVYIVWMILIASWICDTCAYLAGMAFGRHKLAPVLSPKKSIEGAVGGVLGSALAGALFGWLFVERVVPDISFTWRFALIGAVGAVFSQVGDLAASAIKRNRGIKDYSGLIPGHGGIMDRFDSVSFAAPVIYILVVLLRLN